MVADTGCRPDRARLALLDLNAYSLPCILQLPEKPKKDYGDRIGAVRIIPTRIPSR
jgi:hypothetical protein